jgi:putative oxidoreductase
MKLGRLLLRATVGGFFIGHGTQKLFGWFGGEGPEGTGEMFESLGLKPGRAHATAAGVAETAGGTGVLLGFKTPFAASALIAVMLTAINRVHLKNGPWMHKGGYEYNAVLIASAVTLAELGPGKVSVDGLRGKEHKGAFWGLASLVLGAIGAAGAHFAAESQSGDSTYESAAGTEAAAPIDEAPTAAEPASDGGEADESAVHGETAPEGEPAAAETD